MKFAVPQKGNNTLEGNKTAYYQHTVCYCVEFSLHAETCKTW